MTIRASLLLAFVATQALAQEHEHPMGSAEKIGTVHFSTSCSPAAAASFDRAVTLLHSFEIGSAITTFNEVLTVDSTCAMADWGIALSRWSNPTVATLRLPAALERGRVAAAAATRLGERATARERQYIGAVSQLYADYEHQSQRVRQVAYEKAMAGVAAANPADTEAKIFYAIALIASAPPTDKSYANQLKAGTILEALWAVQPNHPGLAHYIIHAYDVPALAPQAEAAADRYADIAPSAAHALHMPSHTFTRLGLWQKSVNTNLRSIAVSQQNGAYAETLHSFDYAEYAYLQMRQDAAAKKILDGLPAIIATFDPNATTGAAPGSAGTFALAAIPARYALERRAWSESAALVANATTLRYPEAMTYLTRALGAAHTGALALARSSGDSLGAIHDQLLAAGDTYWTEQVAIQGLEARAALRFAEGRREEAMVSIREAVAREDATEKSSVTPGPLVPAHELYGDMLMEAKQPADALREYRSSMAKEPNRYRSLYGAMTAARATGDRAAAADYEKQIAKLTGAPIRP
jgi:hypothetical protein